MRSSQAAAVLLIFASLFAAACGTSGGNGPSGGTGGEGDRPTASSPSEGLLAGAADEFATDFTRHNVPYSRISWTTPRITRSPPGSSGSATTGSP